MQYYSTRNHAALFSLQEAAFRGLAPDGGLFMPAVIPHADLEKVRELSECSFSELSRSPKPGRTLLLREPAGFPSR